MENWGHFFFFYHPSTQLHSWSLVEWSSNCTASALTALPHCLHNNISSSFCNWPLFLLSEWSFYLSNLLLLLFSMSWNLPAFCPSPQYCVAFEPCWILLKTYPNMTICLLRGMLSDGLTHPTLPEVLISHVTSLLVHTALAPPALQCTRSLFFSFNLVQHWVASLVFLWKNDPLHHSSKYKIQNFWNTLYQVRSTFNYAFNSIFFSLVWSQELKKVIST